MILFLDFDGVLHAELPPPVITSVACRCLRKS